MKGYVENIGMAPIYILKGVVGKGEKINFDVLLERFGSEADTSSPVAFADWLASHKFVNKKAWNIVIDNKETKLEEPKKEEEEKKLDEPISKVTTTNREIITKSVSGVAKEVTIDDIINIKVSGLGMLKRIKDEKLLRAALKKAERMDKKTMLCNKLRDRLLEFDMR